MSRLMSVSHTEQAVVERRKTVTRRLGWRMLKPGDTLTLCRKVQGRRRKDGTVEPLVRLAEVEVVSIRREALIAMTDDDVPREGVPVEQWGAYPGRGKWAWVEWFCDTMSVLPETEITRIEWRYLPSDGGMLPDLASDR